MKQHSHAAVASTKNPAIQNTNRDEFWTTNPNVLFKTQFNTFTDKLNMVCKFAIVLFVLTLLIGNEPMMLFLPIIMIIGTIMLRLKYTQRINDSRHMHLTANRQQVKQKGGAANTDNTNQQNTCGEFPFEAFERQQNDDEFSNIVIGSKELEENCTQPTIMNPFMNPLYGDNGTTHSAACNVNNDAIVDDIKAKYYHGQSVDPSLPEYLKHNYLGFHAFYTVPSTSHPSKQEEFAQYLYGDMDNCKTNNCDCKPN